MEYEATGVFTAEGPCLLGGLRAEGNGVRCVESVWMVLELVHWGRNHHDNRCLGWYGANLQMVS